MPRSEKELLAEWVEDVRFVMDSPRGRRLVRGILVKTGLFESVFRQPSNMVLPEERLVFNGARRDFGQWLHDQLSEHSPISLDTMNLEYRTQKLLEQSGEAKKEKSDE